jgi:hypothetical protein
MGRREEEKKVNIEKSRYDSKDPPLSRFTQLSAVLRIRIRDPVPFRPLDPGSGVGKKIKIRIRETDLKWTSRIIFPRA